MHNGLGDAFYARPFVRELLTEGRVWVATYWPEVFGDLDVRFVRPAGTKLVPSVMSRERNDGLYEAPPDGARRVDLRWATARMAEIGMQRATEEVSGVHPRDWSVAMEAGPPPVTMDRPYAFVRPVIERTDWPVPSRGANPVYVSRAVEVLRAMGFAIVTTADLRSGEKIVGEPLNADVELHRGELSTMELLALMKHAAVAVTGGVGWALAGAMALGTPAVVIGGGRCGLDGPQTLMEPRAGLTNIRWIMPDRPCMCRDRRHDCNKRIKRFRTKLRAELASLGVTG